LLFSTLVILNPAPDSIILNFTAKKQNKIQSKMTFYEFRQY